MAQVGARALGLRKSVVAGAYIDLLVAIETGARTSFGEIGPVRMLAIEDLVAESIFAATACPRYGLQQIAVAKTLLTAIISGKLEADPQELRRLASSSDYQVSPVLAQLWNEVAAQIQKWYPGARETGDCCPPPSIVHRTDADRS